VIGLPSLQAIDRAHLAGIWMASEATDMRCGFDRLAERVKTVIGENPQSGHLFVFRSRRGDRLKILVWDRGLLLAIDFLAMADAKDKNDQAVVFDLADEPVIAYTVFPELSKPRAVQRLSDAARIV